MKDFVRLVPDLRLQLQLYQLSQPPVTSTRNYDPRIRYPADAGPSPVATAARSANPSLSVAEWPLKESPGGW